MGKISLYTFAATLLFLHSLCSAQQVSTITNPTLELRDNKIHIIYDILNSDTTEQFSVNIEITDSAGQVIEARSLTGDIGEHVPGGEDRRIVWNFMADNIYVDGDLYIQIQAVSDRRVFSRSSLILQSVAFPGLGLSRLAGKPHWIRGLAAYGCVAGSVALNRMAINTYQDYQNPGSAENAGTLLEKARQQDQASEVLAFVAAGIWITDVVWTLIGTSGMNQAVNRAAGKGISVHPGYDPGIQAPVLSFNYRF